MSHNKNVPDKKGDKKDVKVVSVKDFVAVAAAAAITEANKEDGVGTASAEVSDNDTEGVVVSAIVPDKLISSNKPNMSLFKHMKFSTVSSANFVAGKVVAGKDKVVELFQKKEKPIMRSAAEICAEQYQRSLDFAKENGVDINEEIKKVREMLNPVLVAKVETAV